MSNNKKYNVIFLGTPLIAKVTLAELCKIPNVNVLAIFCQPDNHFDRKGNVVLSPVKQFALEKNINCYQPEDINDDFEIIKQLNPDIIITCAYGQFVKENILNIPKYGCVNLHASLLPKLRGGAPIHWAIINGEKETGISLMYMVKKMDAGNVIKQYKIKINDDDTYQILYTKLCDLIKSFLIDDFKILVSDNVKSIPQDENKVTFGLNIKKEDTIINFNNSSLSIYNLIRGLNDSPVAKIKFKNTLIKVYSCLISQNKSTEKPGTIVSISKKGLEVATKDFNIFLDQIQLPSKQIRKVSELMNGNFIFVVGQQL